MRESAASTAMSTTTAAASAGTGSGGTGSSSSTGGGKGFTGMMASLNPFGKKGRSVSGSTSSGRGSGGRGGVAAGGKEGNNNAGTVPRSYRMNGVGGTDRSSSERLAGAEEEEQAPLPQRRCVFFKVFYDKFLVTDCCRVFCMSFCEHETNYGKVRDEKKLSPLSCNSYTTYCSTAASFPLSPLFLVDTSQLSSLNISTPSSSRLIFSLSTDRPTGTYSYDTCTICIK